MKDYLERPGLEEESQAFDIDQLLHYWEIIKQRIWILISTFVIVFVTGIIYTFNVTPVYQATTTLIIDSDIPQLVNIDNISNSYKSEEFFQTQLEIINSRAVAERTINSLLESNNAYLQEFEETPENKQLINSLISRIDIETEKNTRLVKLSIKNTDPEMAAEEVNTLAINYINYNLEDRKATSQDAFLWLTEQLAILKSKVEKSEMDLLKYKETENIVSLEKRQVLLEERIAETNASYIEANTKYMELQTMLTEIGNLDNWKEAESLPRILENPLIGSLKQKYNELQSQLAEISKKYKPKHPKIVTLESQLKDIEERLKNEIDKKIKSLEIEAKIYQSNINTIESNLSRLKQQSMDLAKQAIQYGVLKREAESNKNMYDVLLHRLKETDISGKVTANNIRIVDPALVPGSPVVPNKKLYLLATLLFAISLGVGLSLFIDFIDNTVKSDIDIKNSFKETTFGVVPFVKDLEEQDINAFNSFSRAYNEIKTNISFYQKEHMLKTAMITSSDQSEGKTTSVYFIARAFAKTGQKVLMVDADLFRPKLGKMMKLSNHAGISDHLLNGTPLKELIVPNLEKNLSFLPAGLIPPNPAELIGSDRLKEILDQIKGDYDIVLVDSPPVNSTIEVSVLSTYVDAVILTIKAQSTTKHTIKRAFTNLRNKGANIIGTVLTASKINDKFAYYYYHQRGSDAS
jgi:capsular exopolysaccharide synthesis family protein